MWVLKDNRFTYHPIEVKRCLPTEYLYQDKSLKLFQEADNCTVTFHVIADKRKSFTHLTNDGWLLLMFNRGSEDKEVKETIWSSRVIVAIRGVEDNWCNYLFSVKRGR